MGHAEIDIEALERALPRGFRLYMPPPPDEVSKPGEYAQVMDVAAGHTHGVGGGFVFHREMPRELALALCDIRRCSSISCEDVLLDDEMECPTCGALVPFRKEPHVHTVPRSEAALIQASMLIPGAWSLFPVAEDGVLWGRRVVCGDHAVTLALLTPAGRSPVARMVIDHEHLLSDGTWSNDHGELNHHLPCFMHDRAFQLPMRIEWPDGQLDLLIEDGAR